ncbi:uncharacterized protein N7496_010529 [Penicillium cataractarum]|uniref:Uncharacterized protein n=1 Tax=Penicillium cataractarum TaxID=2100454 RepID=A0A9W9RR13_9EURO|nr:uncharacterized protein N7496_010529 [Penicillium cataractarum]KAJ5364816.1 hypothetical protein N7496_010529 [Penicillium cataractarum]
MVRESLGRHHDRELNHMEEFYRRLVLSSRYTRQARERSRSPLSESERLERLYGLYGSSRSVFASQNGQAHSMSWSGATSDRPLSPQLEGLHEPEPSSDTQDANGSTHSHHPTGSASVAGAHPAGPSTTDSAEGEVQGNDLGNDATRSG